MGEAVRSTARFICSMDRNYMYKFTITLLTVSLFFVPRVIAADDYRSSSAASISSDCIIKAMTFNVRVDTFLDAVGNSWSSRKQLAINAIRRNNPDVIGIQESLFKQVLDLRDGLSEYECYSAGRKNGDTKGESCAIFFRRDRLKLIDYGTFWFSDTPNRPGSKDWGNIPPRICSWITLGDINTGKAFYVYNLHLDNMSQKSRRKSIQLLAKKIASRKAKNPFIILGDFNMKIDNPAMRYLCKSNIKDAWSAIRPANLRGTGTRHGFNGSVNGPRIDHIPVCSTAEVLDIKIDRYNRNGKYPSDHFPVIATINFCE